MPDLPTIELGAIAPEASLLVTALVILVVDAFVRDRVGGWWMSYVSALGLIVAAAFAWTQWGHAELQLSGMVAVDGFSVFVKIALALFGFLALWLSREYLVREGIEESEYYALMLFAVAGMMLMAAAADLIVIFLALETFSLAIYVLVAFRRVSLIGQEGAMKYFLLGTFSSTFFLLGIALAYGAAGSTRLYGGAAGGLERGILDFLTSNPASDVGLLVLAMALLLVGLAFKVAAVPFHMWTPDAYQGAPSPVTGFMAAATKLAAFAALLRVLLVALFPLRWEWRPVLAVIAAVTMIVGSLFALVQEDVKRMLAYSSIAHAGFLLTAVVAATDRGVSGALFYLVTYGLTIVGAFAVVAILAGREEQRVRLVDYKGAFYDNPLLSSAFALFLLSLAGVPITSGFVGKVLVFGAAIDAGYMWLVIVGMLASAIATFFYLRILVVMYMQERAVATPAPVPGYLSTGVVALTAVATVVLGLFWEPLANIVEQATFFFATP